MNPRRSPRDSLLDGRYRLGERIGKGALTDVYSAVHVLTGREHAVKKWRIDIDDAAAAARWRREILLENSVLHPAVVPIFDAGFADDGKPFLVMDRLYGEDLAARLRRGPLSLDDTLGIFEQLIDALAAAHASGIVHRDLRPANVFLQRSEAGAARVRLLDFGFARQLQPSITRLTAQGESVGSLAYMAPEQVTARDDVGPAADVWAVGVVLYESLAGHRPFEGDSIDAVTSAIGGGGVVPIAERAPHVPKIMASVIAKCLSVEVEQRYPDASMLAMAWGAVIATRSRWYRDSRVEHQRILYPESGRAPRAPSPRMHTGPLEVMPPRRAGREAAPRSTDASSIPAARPAAGAIFPTTAPSGSTADSLTPSDFASTMPHHPQTSGLGEAPSSASSPESGIRFTRRVRVARSAATWARVPATFMIAIVLAVLSFGLLAMRDTLIVPLLAGSPEDIGGIVLDHVWTPAVNITAAAAVVAALVLAAVALVQVLRRRARAGAREFNQP